jgi:Stage II sporulation protein E (SpoIIE)
VTEGFVVSHGSEHRSPARPLSRAALIALAACCIALFALIPVAIARPAHHGKGKHAVVGPAQITTKPEAEQAPAEQEAAASEEASEAPEQAQAPEQQEAATQQGGAVGGQTARTRHKGTRESGHHKEGAKEPGHRKEDAGETERSRESGKQGEQGQPVPTSPIPDAPAATSTPLAAQPIQPTASTASTVAPVVAAAPRTTTAAVAAPTVADTSMQGRSSGRAHAPRSASAAARRRAARAVPADRALATVPATQLRAGLTSRSSKPSGGARKQSSRKAAGAGRPSPITTTITRIVDVVPTPVRVLIAALLALALALAVRSRMAALRTGRLERQRGQLLEDVGLLQAALLPVPPERLGPVGTSVAYRPAAGPGAGGDFYDVFALEDGQLAVIVGDVSGHGRHALPHTALVRFTLRAYLEAGLSPRDAVQKAGTVLERQLGDQFVTVVAATYNPRERVLVYACAGHPPPVVLATDGDSRSRGDSGSDGDPGSQVDAGSLQPVTVCSAPPIGCGLRTGTRQSVVSVPGRSQVCFYTDGVTEARVGDELFGAERLLVTLAELGGQATASSMLESVVVQTDARADDMAACLLQVQGGDGTPTALAEELELDRRQLESGRVERFLLACGVSPAQSAEMLGAARAALARAETVVLELHLADGPPRLALRRDHLSYLHAQHENVEVYR